MTTEAWVDLPVIILIKLPSHLVVVGKTRVAFDNIWDKSCICLLSLATTQAQPETWKGWAEIKSKLDFVTWDDSTYKWLNN